MHHEDCQSTVANPIDASSIRLNDVIDIRVLQCLQDEFAKGVGVASITVDLDGNPITTPSNYSRFCMDYTHSTECGDKRCALSHRIGGEEAARLGKPVVYECHAGLIDFAAPILLEGRQIGTILGGQVLTDAPDELKYRRIAREIGVDEHGYIEAVKEICPISKERVKAAANVLFIVANYMSKTAYHQQLLRARSHLLRCGLNQISVSVQKLAGSENTTEVKHKSKCGMTNLVAGQFDEVIDLIDNIEDFISGQQKDMARLERLNLIGEMAVNIGHEVRNPLTTVRGFLQFFSKKAEFNQYSTAFNIMIEELDRANEIITEFLSLAKNRKVDLKSLDLNLILRNLCESLQKDAMSKNVKIRFRLNTISRLLLDEKEIRQLALHLVRNAIEATKENGVVEIATFMEDDKPVLQIIDEGDGIPKDILEKIGTPFLSTKPSGTGMGLAVCFRIAERHSASIIVDSHELVGTKIRVIFNQSF